MRIDGFLFDKDGTLFDFRATWDVWADALIEDLAQGDGAQAAALAQAMGFDRATKQFLPHSTVIAGTNREAAQCVASALPGWDLEALELELAQRAAQAPLAPAVDLVPFLQGLAQRGLALGVMTNDAELSARAQLEKADVATHFDFIAGFDSGFGAKPDPKPLLAFAEQMQLDPQHVVMVGDSTHDLIAGRRAGMKTLGVLTGTALREDLEDLADAVLPDIGHIPAWLDQQTV